MADSVALDTLLDSLEENLENVRLSFPGLKVPSKRKHPSSLKEASFAVLQDNKGILESQIESLMKCCPVVLPNDRETLLKIGNDRMQKNVLTHKESVNYSTDMKKNLVDEYRKYQHMISNAEHVEKKLDDLILTPTNVDQLTDLKRRHQHAGIVFKELREELQWYLSTHFAQDSMSKLSMEDLLSLLTRKFLEDPTDPYVDFNPNEMRMEDVEFLIRAQMVMRHRDDYTKIRLMDFTVE